MVSRVPVVIANWKMNMSLGGAESFAAELLPLLADDHIDVAISPSAVHLSRVEATCRGTGIAVYAQTCHSEQSGPHTGEISAAMLSEAGMSGILAGHSERRRDHGESDEVVHAKVNAIVAAGLTPVLCVGESLAERDEGSTDTVLERQLRLGIGESEIPDTLILAYEPVWAIGTGRSASPEQAGDAIGGLRRCLETLRGESFAAAVRILYGGSVSPDTAESLFEGARVDGALVGNASLGAESFSAIVNAAVACRVA